MCGGERYGGDACRTNLVHLFRDGYLKGPTMSEFSLETAVQMIIEARNHVREADVLIGESRRIMAEVIAALGARNDEREMRDVAAYLPEGDGDREMLLMMADVKAKGLLPYGQRPTIDPSAITSGMKVIYCDDYIRETLAYTTSTALDHGEVIEVIPYHPTTGQQVANWMPGGRIHARVRWSWHEGQQADRTDVSRLAKA